MAAQTRAMANMDKSADGLPFDPTIRIPPIQDPSPLQVISSHRPSPLEPKTAEGSRSSAVRFTSRSKALATAKPLGNDSPLRPLDTSHISNAARQSQDGQQELGSRKRQRVDYFQLPKPTQPSHSERNSSLDTIPRLNQLNEPPPSAARFPPITTTTNSPVLHRAEHDGTQLKARTSKTPKQVATSPGSPEDLSPHEEVKKPKRNYTRGRRMWTDEETEHLLKGVSRYGVGKWKRIINDPEFHFPADRTAVDLKDRYRTCRMHEERRIERHANGDPQSEEVSPISQAKKAKKVPKVLPRGSEQASSKREDKKASEGEKGGMEQGGFSFVSVNTVQDMAEELNKPKPEPKWSAEDDSNLSKGFQKYGFHWTAISKDQELNLHQRTGPQLRDRFRVKFPIHYQSSVPIELPDPRPGYDRDQRPRRRRVSTAAKAAAGLSSGVKQLDASKLKDEAAPHQAASKTISIADIVKPADPSAPAKDSSSKSKPSLPSVQSLCAQVDAQPLPDSASGPAIDIQPLPEEGEEFDESDFDGSSDLGHDGSGSSSQPYRHFFPSQILQNSQGTAGVGGGGGGGGELDSGDESDESASAAAAAAAVAAGDDVRHLGILGLLNDRDQEITRLPPFRSAYDDANEDWGQDSVTLPPLLWEAMAPKPMFDLD